MQKSEVGKKDEVGKKKLETNAVGKCFKPYGIIPVLRNIVNCCKSIWMSGRWLMFHWIVQSQCLPDGACIRRRIVDGLNRLL